MTAPVERSLSTSGSLVASLGPLRRTLILALCVLVVGAEGYDVQAMAFAAPIVARVWGSAPSQIGILLTASVMGLIGGGLFLAPLGDRFGRRPATLIGLLIAGLFTAACAFAPSVPLLALLRVGAGLGLGLSIPNIFAIALETAKDNQRTLAVIIANCGYPLGAGAGGLVVSRLVNGVTFAPVFVLGAGATAVALVLSFLALPETWRRDSSSRTADQGAPPRGSLELLKELFGPERASATIVFWTLNFTAIASVYFMNSWLPTLLSYNGLSGSAAIVAASVFNASAIGGGLLMALAQRRLQAFEVLTSAYAVAAMSVCALAMLQLGGAALLGVVALAGASVAGSQFALSAAVNQFYPPAIRVGASGYALGVGRIGALLAPLCGGFLIQATSSARPVFLVTAGLSVVALAATLKLRLLQRTTTDRLTPSFAEFRKSPRKAPRPF